MKRSLFTLTIIQTLNPKILHPSGRSRSAPGSSERFSPLPNQRSVSYKVRLDDVGCHLKCDCTVVDIFGRAAEPVACVTEVVRAGEKRARGLGFGCGLTWFVLSHVMRWHCCWYLRTGGKRPKNGNRWRGL
jgi:hypothetical protein